MKTYTPEQVERIVHLRELRIKLLRGEVRASIRKLRNVNGELFQLTQNNAYR